jgi:hypothetical protein
MPVILKDEDFLTKVRTRFKNYLEKWRDIRDAHDKDIRMITGDPWDDKEKQSRTQKAIPMVSLDELTQYINQLVNDIRQNKRAVNVLPKGSGANDATASLRADWIRAIEYISQAQTAYVTAFEGMVQGSYGFCKLECYYESPKSFEQSVRIMPIPNGNTIVYDPDCVQYDCSDAEDCFELNLLSHDKFRRDFPKAEIRDFGEDVQHIAPNWIGDKSVQIASYWKVELTSIQLHLVKLPDGKTQVMRSDQLPEKFDKSLILKSRDYDDRRIVQYVLNGVEVLEKNDPRDGKGWPGNWIPIIPFWGKELFVDEGSGSKRMLFSLIRLARDPQRLLNYYASQELMEAKLTPRTPYMGPKGMFSDQADQWADINEVPKAYVEYTLPEGMPPGTKPERTPFVPNFQAYEMAKEAASRSIMKAMGISPLPTAAQRQNEKSGVALSKIEGERAQGSFHFIDNLDRSLVYLGKQLDDLFDKIHDTPRDIPLRKEDGTHSVARINDPASQKNKLFAGDHDVTITTGPSYESQREEAADFADTISKIPGVFPLIGDLIVRLRNIGPIGQQIADRLTPPQFAQQDGAEPLPPAAQSQIAHLTGQLQQLQQLVQQLNQEKAAKMWEMGSKLEIEKIHSDTQKAVAEINTKAQLLSERLKALEDLQADFHQMAHEQGMSAQEHQQDLQQATHESSLTPEPEQEQTPAEAQ